MPNIPDVLKTLRKASFRGIEFPILERDAGFSHSNARHKLEYRNGELVESTGAQAWTFTYTIPCRQGLIYTEYGNLFSDTLRKLVTALRDKEPGPLVDPIDGEFQVVPASYQELLDVNKRDGIDLRIELVHAPEYDDIEAGNEIPAFQGLENASNVVNQQIELVDWEQELPPEPTVNPFQAFRGVIQRFDQQLENSLIGIERFIEETKAVERAVDNAGKPEAQALSRVSRKSREAAHRAHRNLRRPDRKVSQVLNTQARGISEVAASVRMNLDDFLAVNPELRGVLLVPANVTVFVTRNAS